MAISTTRFMFFAVLVCSLAVILGNKTVAAQCQGDLQGLVDQCAGYLRNPKIQPSSGCCSVVNNVDLVCVCDQLTSQAGNIDLQKIAVLGQACGKSLPQGTQCGSYVQP